MPRSNRPSDYARLLHIEEACTYVLESCAGRELPSFEADRAFRESVVFNLNNIGEAATSLSEETRALMPEVAWPAVIRSRNFRTHVYWGINFAIVWETVASDVPILLRAVRRALTIVPQDPP